MIVAQIHGFLRVAVPSTMSETVMGRKARRDVRGLAVASAGKGTVGGSEPEKPDTAISPA